MRGRRPAARIVPIPYPCPNEIYEARMGEAVAQRRADGVTHMIFGDLFLADIRAYREQKLAGTGITPVFPLWERPTLPTGAGDDRKRAGGLSRHRRSEEAAGGIRRAANSMRNCSPICPTASIPAARTASFTPAWWRGRCFRGGSRCTRRARRARRLCLLRSGDGYGARACKRACHSG